MTPELQRFIVPRAPAMTRPSHLEGKFLIFDYQGQLAYESYWTVYSRRGGFVMGNVEWSPQWRAWMFRPQGEAVFPLSAVAEIYAFVKGLGGRQV